jgi:23S rRNA A1618 N6-methylase RlmF
LLRQVLPCTHRYFPNAREFDFRGLDIGTGATAIYPLLFVASTMPTHDDDAANSSYHMYATDIDAESVGLARENVRCNQLESRIQVLLVPQEEEDKEEGLPSRRGPLSTSLACIPPNDRALDFCITNPPFFDSLVDGDTIVKHARQGDGRARTNMTVSEGSYPGGEFAFCLDILIDGLVMFAQSLKVPSSSPSPPLWSACMCGKKTSWLQLKAVLTQVIGPSRVLATEFGPGHLTRWFLAWTFEQPVKDSPLAKYGSDLDFNVSLDASLQGAARTEEVERRVDQYLKEFPDAKLAIVSNIESMGRRRLQICEAPGDITLFSAEDQNSQLPERLRNVLAEMNSTYSQRLLPSEGHIWMTVDVSFMDPLAGDVHVKSTFYAHSVRGRRLVDKMRLQLESEICQTSRRWRRRLKQQQREDTVSMEKTR